jgi:hypothetical protein
MRFFPALLHAMDTVRQSALARHFLILGEATRLLALLPAKSEALLRLLAAVRCACHVLVVCAMRHPMAAPVMALGVPNLVATARLLLLTSVLLRLLLGVLLRVLLGLLAALLPARRWGLPLCECLPEDEKTGGGDKQCFLHHTTPVETTQRHKSPTILAFHEWPFSSMLSTRVHGACIPQILQDALRAGSLPSVAPQSHFDCVKPQGDISKRHLLLKYLFVEAAFHRPTFSQHSGL